MFQKGAIFILAALLIAGSASAQKLTINQIKQAKAQINKLSKDVNQLRIRLKKAKAKQLRLDITDKMNFELEQIAKIKKKIYPKPATKKKKVKPKAAPVEAIPSIEAAPEETASYEAAAGARWIARGFNYEVGGVYGFFAGATTFLGEARIPFRMVFGPATTTLRLATGLAQSQSADRRFVPLNLDLIFNFPPGWFTGVENYVGAGLNYMLLTTGHKQGTIGGEVFYGVQSEGFGGVVFGEMGYGALRTGFSSSQKGVTVMVGYRKPLGF